MNNFIKCGNIALKKIFTHIYITNILRAHHMHGEGMHGMGTPNECKCRKTTYRYCPESLILC